MALKAGYKGKVKIGATVIGGSVSWSYSGSVREILDSTEFGDENKRFILGQAEGGEITITGHYLMDEDVGQQLLKSNFEGSVEMTDVQLYISLNDSFYLTPDDSLVPPSYCIITKYDNVENTQSGTGTFTCTMKVSGRMKPVY